MTSLRSSRAAIAVVAIIALLVSACATRPPEDDPAAVAAYEEANDPLEPFNRAMWDFNTFLDKAIAQPITWVYRKIIPKPLRDIFTNVATNAGKPITIVNSLLQGNFRRAGLATERLLVNTVIGVGGIADPASAWGIPEFEEDFGQTLAVWGVGDEPYLVLPVVGPTNPRDAAGFAGDSISEPVSLALDIADHRYPRIGWSIGTVIESRDRNWQQIKEVRRARDPYVFARSAFRQNRAFEINNGKPVQSEEEERLFEEDFSAGGDTEADFRLSAAEESPADGEVERDRIERILLGPDFRLHADDDPPRAAPPSGAGFSLH